MPQAPNYDSLHNFEEIFEKAVADLINAAGIAGLNALPARDEEELENDPAMLELAVQFEVGPASGSKKFLGFATIEGKQVALCEFERYDNCTLEIQVSANRYEDTGSAIPEVRSKLAEVRAKIRTLMRERAWPLNDNNLKYYRVSRLQPNGGQTGVTQNKEKDVVTLRYAVDFCIMPDAWPAE
jgi:hypothetical protein